MKKENKIAVLIPCYNESKTIEKVVKNTDKVSREIKTGNEKINDENNKKNNE